MSVISNEKNRHCSRSCDYISCVKDYYYGDIICFCNYDHRRYVGFIDDVDHGVEECIYPNHPLNDDERYEDLKTAWSEFIVAIKETELYERFQSLADWISERVFK